MHAPSTTDCLESMEAAEQLTDAWALFKDAYDVAKEVGRRTGMHVARVEAYAEAQVHGAAFGESLDSMVTKMVEFLDCGDDEE